MYIYIHCEWDLCDVCACACSVYILYLPLSSRGSLYRVGRPKGLLADFDSAGPRPNIKGNTPNLGIEHEGSTTDTNYSGQLNPLSPIRLQTQTRNNRTGAQSSSQNQRQPGKQTFLLSGLYRHQPGLWQGVAHGTVIQNWLSRTWCTPS